MDPFGSDPEHSRRSNRADGDWWNQLIANSPLWSSEGSLARDGFPVGHFLGVGHLLGGNPESRSSGSPRAGSAEGASVTGGAVTGGSAGDGSANAEDDTATAGDAAGANSAGVDTGSAGGAGAGAGAGLGDAGDADGGAGRGRGAGRDGGRRSSWVLVGSLRESAQALALTPLPDDAGVCLAEAEELMVVRDRITSALAGRVGRVHRSGLAKQYGHASTRSWLRTAGGMTVAGAGRLLTLGIELARLPRVQEAFAEGRLTAGVVEAICTATAGLKEEQAGLAEPILLELAVKGGPAEVARAGRYLRAVLDPDGEERDERADYGRRFLRVRPGKGGGLEGEFHLPREAAARLRALLDAYARPRAEGDDRPLSVRQADALIALLEQKIVAELLVLVNAESLPTDPAPDADPVADQGEQGEQGEQGDDANHPGDVQDGRDGRDGQGTYATEPTAPELIDSGESVEPAEAVELTLGAPGEAGGTDAVAPGTGAAGLGDADGCAQAKSNEPEVGQQGGTQPEGAQSEKVQPERARLSERQQHKPRQRESQQEKPQQGESQQGESQQGESQQSGPGSGRSRWVEWQPPDPPPGDISARHAHAGPRPAGGTRHGLDMCEAYGDVRGGQRTPGLGTCEIHGCEIHGCVNHGDGRWGHGESACGCGGARRSSSESPVTPPGPPEGAPQTPSAGPGKAPEQGPGLGPGPKTGPKTWPGTLPGALLGRAPGLLLATGQVLPVSGVHRLARTSALVRLVMNADGQVLDMGRKVRLATPAQRRAVFARYATCWIDGCPLPATMCQIDHADNWSTGGLTDLKLLGPACQFHNRDRYQHPERYTRHTTGKDRWAFTYHRLTGATRLGR
ncbi:DUF222 domain-containing protein [Microbispora sp. CA-135349]|uniref:HNH endonuclease signature motif containing protein n=1 Tax=Microbispora sp. CA-135349 TaxID=3239953 RepID=UPI003D8A45A5